MKYRCTVVLKEETATCTKVSFHVASAPPFQPIRDVLPDRKILSGSTASHKQNYKYSEGKIKRAKAINSLELES